MPNSVYDRFSLSGKTAIITGIGPGIGSHVASAFAEAGANVVLMARGADKVRALADTINARADTINARADGGRALAVPGDVGRKDDLDRLVKEASSAFGAVDIIFNSAAGGFGPSKTALDASDEEWIDGLNVNVLAPMRLAKALVPEMKARGEGSIINVLTTSAFLPTLPYIAYGSTKAALHMLTRYLAKECGPEVRVNAISPGGVRPEPPEGGIVRDPTLRMPLQRTGYADDFVGAALYLASGASSYVTGTVLYVDGGHTATVT